MARLHDRSPQAVRNARLKASLTQEEAASLIHACSRAWTFYEAGDREIPLASWELFLLKTKQHPDYKLR